MTLEEINDVDDKALRLRLLQEYMRRILQDQRDEDELTADEEMNATRDYAHGMMSRFGKPETE
ncbi:MAG TPA: hypothetical protein VFZ23_10000 [Pyrinomonadaceae bacterium]